MTIYNRENFLNNIADNLGRPVRKQVERPVWKFQPQHEVLKDATPDELVEVLKKQCQNIHTSFVSTTTEQLATTLQQVVDECGGKSVITWKDDRFEKFGLLPLMTEQWPKNDIAFYEWDEKIPKKIFDMLKKRILVLQLVK